jgi:dienelactone hydrolase
MRCLPVASLPALLLLAVVRAGDASPPVEKGTVHFRPLDDQHNVPERYRLAEHTFPFELTLKRSLPGIDVDVFVLRYPSPVETPCPENNTVYAEYYRPRGPGPFPAVIVLDVTAGNQMLSRSMATYLAQNGIAGLFVQMAYYGPRRPPGSRLRLLSPNVPHTLEAVRQTVLDLRRAGAWLASRPELDAARLGIVGTSLGSFIGALTAEMEPRLGRVAVLLGGGGLVDAYYDHPKARLARQAYEALGGSKEKLARLIAPADPLTCAANLKERKLLMLAGRRDDVVPPRMAEALWRASGRQRLVWYDCTHLGAVLYIVPAMSELVRHFGAP